MCACGKSLCQVYSANASLVKARGIYTLLGRGQIPAKLMDEILVLCSSFATLRYACLAYEANSKYDSHHPCTSDYLDLALARYQDDLRRPETLHADATLLAGVLLCSLSVRHCVS